MYRFTYVHYSSGIFRLTDKTFSFFAVLTFFYSNSSLSFFISPKIFSVFLCPYIFIAILNNGWRIFRLTDKTFSFFAVLTFFYSNSSLSFFISPKIFSVFLCPYIFIAILNNGWRIFCLTDKTFSFFAVLTLHSMVKFFSIPH